MEVLEAGKLGHWRRCFRASSSPAPSHPELLHSAFINHHSIHSGCDDLSQALFLFREYLSECFSVKKKDYSMVYGVPKKLFFLAFKSHVFRKKLSLHCVYFVTMHLPFLPAVAFLLSHLCLLYYVPFRS